MHVIGDIFSGRISFENPWGFLLLLLIPIGYWLISHFRRSAMIFPVTRRFVKASRSVRVVLWRFMPHILAITIIMFSVGVSRPQSSTEIEKVFTEGIDITIALDISSSMRAMDFKPKDRIEAAKQEAENFIMGRPDDRIGVVVFASKAFPQCPLTIDHNIVIELLRNVEIGMIEDGTAIGDAIITASNRLRKSKAKSKVVILLTDGRSNTGKIDPITAAQAAAALDIKIYTIGIGKRGRALYPVQTPFGGTRLVPMDVEIDEETLGKIAAEANGKYFRATDEERLRAIYNEINKLEKTKIEVKKFRRHAELYYLPVFFGFILLLLYVLLENFIVRSLP